MNGSACFPAESERKHLSVFRYVQIAVVIFPPLRGVVFLPVGQILVFGMPEHQIGDLQLFRQPAGVHDGAVVLFIGFEAVPLAVQAERLMEQPLGTLYPGEQGFVAGFVSRKGKPYAFFHPDAVAELLFLGGTNIKKVKWSPRISF